MTKIDLKFQLGALLCSLIFMFSCNSEANWDGYIIEGSITNATESKLFLEEFTKSTISIVDTATIGEDGTFKFKGKLADKSLYRIRQGKDRFWMLVLGNDKVTAELDADNTINYTIDGTSSNRRLAKLHGALMTRQEKLQEQTNKYYQMVANGEDQRRVQTFRTELQLEAQSIQGFLKNYADTTNDVHVSLYAANYLMMEGFIPFFKKYVARLDREIPGSVYAKEYREQLAIAEQNLLAKQQQERRHAKTAIGAVAQEIDLPSPSGKSIKLSSLKGKYVLIDFWASWCGPCRRENPNVVKLYDEFKSKGFTVYSVSLDKDRNKWVKAIEKDNLKWKNHVSDLKGWQSSAGQLYGVSSIPATFLIDPEGKIIAKNLRGAALDAKVKELLDA